MTMNAFNLFLGIMSLIALIVFIVLYFVKAGYGIFRTASWGVAISNKLAWILMEAPVFLVMCWMWVHSERRFDPVILMFFIFFQIHYFQRRLTVTNRHVQTRSSGSLHAARIPQAYKTRPARV